MDDEALLKALRRVAEEDRGPREGYAALEALTRGDITPEELRLLEEKAQASPEWAAAVAAHRPPAPEAKQALSRRLLESLDRDARASTAPAQPSRRRRAWPIFGAGAFAAAAAGAALVIATWTPALPRYAALADGSAMCSGASVRGGGPPHEGACLRFILRPETSDPSEIEVRVYAADEPERPLQAAALERLEGGVVHLYLDPQELARGRVERGGLSPPKALILIVARPGRTAGAQKLTVSLDAP